MVIYFSRKLPRCENKANQEQTNPHHVKKKTVMHKIETISLKRNIPFL